MFCLILTTDRWKHGFSVVDCETFSKKGMAKPLQDVNDKKLTALVDCKICLMGGGVPWGRSFRKHIAFRFFTDLSVGSNSKVLEEA